MGLAVGPWPYSTEEKPMSGTSLSISPLWDPQNLKCLTCGTTQLPSVFSKIPSRHGCPPRLLLCTSLSPRLQASCYSERAELLFQGWIHPPLVTPFRWLIYMDFRCQVDHVPGQL